MSSSSSSSEPSSSSSTSSSSSSLSSSSSSSPPSSSSSSSAGGCVGNCKWVFDPFFGWKDIENPCLGECKCTEPTFAVPATLDADEAFTPCRILTTPSTSSSSGELLPLAMRSLAAPANEIVAIFPKVSDPAQWDKRTRPAPESWDAIQSPAYGWMFTFLRTPGPTVPEWVPHTTPADEPDVSETGMSASVIVPESSGPRQYWVTVLEKYRWAQLRTSEWTVVILKLPNPATP